ncbi:MAG TPA: hypothetical protein VN772_07155, partial [Solirubrobacteraceae bacterium]|nr:hypothetical protein [Solirubrobacteraceae bacterium]
MDTMRAHREWASRPADQRFTSLTELAAFCAKQRETSSQIVLPSNKIGAAPDGEGRDAGLVIDMPRSQSRPTHWSFGQLASLAGAPPSYLRDLPAALAADCINYGLRYNRAAEDVGILLTRRDEAFGSELEMRAATGPRYGRIWNGGEGGVVDALVHRFGDGISGDWRVPGE